MVGDNDPSIIRHECTHVTDEQILDYKYGYDPIKINACQENIKKFIPVVRNCLIGHLNNQKTDQKCKDIKKLAKPYVHRPIIKPCRNIQNISKFFEQKLDNTGIIFWVKSITGEEQSLCASQADSIHNLKTGNKRKVTREEKALIQLYYVLKTIPSKEIIELLYSEHDFPFEYHANTIGPLTEWLVEILCSKGVRKEKTTTRANVYSSSITQVEEKDL